MGDAALVTDDDLARARVDAEFRHRLVADKLDLLLTELNRLRGSKSSSRRSLQLREGVNLAVKLAELLQRIERPSASPPTDAVADAGRPGAAA